MLKNVILSMELKMQGSTGTFKNITAMAGGVAIVASSVSAWAAADEVCLSNEGVQQQAYYSQGEGYSDDVLKLLQNGSGGYSALYARYRPEEILTDFSNKMIEGMHDVPTEFRETLEDIFWDVLA